MHVSDGLLGWITTLVRATRPSAEAPKAINDYVRWGAGPRAGQALVLAAKARALVHGRLAATRGDVRALAAPVLRHRMILNFNAEADNVTPDELIEQLKERLPVWKKEHYVDGASEWVEGNVPPGTASGAEPAAVGTGGDA